MPKSIDKNDVDINKLFSWSNKFVLNHRGNEYNVYMRLLGDADLNRARVYALRESAKLRKELREDNSDNRLAMIPLMEDTTKEDIIDGLLMAQTRDYTEDAVRTLKFNIPKEPDSDATLEDREKYQKEIDEWPFKREKAVQEYVEEKMKGIKESLEKKSKEDLWKDYLEEVIDRLCSIRMLTDFREMSAYLGSFRDRECEKRLFDTFEDFQNSPSDVKSQLIEFYSELEIDGEELKK